MTINELLHHQVQTDLIIVADKLVYDADSEYTDPDQTYIITQPNTAIMLLRSIMADMPAIKSNMDNRNSISDLISRYSNAAIDMKHNTIELLCNDIDGLLFA